MAITKNHSSQNNVSKMYDAVKNDKIELIKEVDAAGGDIYDQYGLGTFFIRAMTSNAKEVFNYYLAKHDLGEQLKKYKDRAFYDAICNADLSMFKDLINQGITKNIINISGIATNRSFHKSKTFYYKSMMIAKLFDIDYYHSVAKLSKTNLLNESIVSNDFNTFIQSYENRDELGVNLTMETIFSVLTSCDFVNSKESIDTTGDKAKVLSIIMQELEKEMSNNITYLEVCENLSKNVILKFKALTEKGTDNTIDNILEFFNHLLDTYATHPFVMGIKPSLKAYLLINWQNNITMLDKYFAMLSDSVSCEPISIGQDVMMSLIEYNRASSHKYAIEAHGIGMSFLRSLLIASNIDISDPISCIQNTAKESKPIKKAILYHAIDEIGFTKTLESIKHTSYITSLYEIGYAPYDILPHITETRLQTKVIEDMTK